MKCDRCNLPILADDRWVYDPCCGAPDCDSANAVSHFTCLPLALQRLEDSYNED